MTQITKPILLDETGLKIVDSLNSIAAIISATGTYDYSDWNKIKNLVRLGIAEKALPVGSQIVTNWTDKAANVTYAVPWDIVHYGNVTLQDGETVNGMYLQWHYATPFGVQFDNYEAFYYATAVLPAGTYNVTMGSLWGTNVVSGKTYQFTLTKDLPVGGQLSGLEGAPDVTPANWKVKAWASNTATTATETVSVTEGNLGTNLGILKAGGGGTLNCLQRTGYGYNRWSASAIRQWLNSAGAVNAWWTPKHNWDRNPNELLTKQGFLSGFDDDFLAALTAVKVTTALNTVSDAAIGTTENTYDKIFLPSLQQKYITPQLADVEGESWEYWKQASGLTSPAPYSTSFSQYINYGIDNKILAQNVRLRSASRSDSYDTWFVATDGRSSNLNSVSAHRCTPACVIC